MSHFRVCTCCTLRWVWCGIRYLKAVPFRFASLSTAPLIIEVDFRGSAAIDYISHHVIHKLLKRVRKRLKFTITVSIVEVWERFTLFLKFKVSLYICCEECVLLSVKCNSHYCYNFFLSQLCYNYRLWLLPPVHLYT